MTYTFIVRDIGKNRVPVPEIGVLFFPLSLKRRNGSLPGRGGEIPAVCFRAFRGSGFPFSNSSD